MNGFLRAVEQIGKFLNIVAGISLIFLMLLTIVDVILRGFGRPMVGTYELVAFSGAIAIGLAMPRTALLRGHIYVDFLIAKFSRTVRDLFNFATRGLVFILFALAGWNLLKFGWDLQKSGEVSLTLQMPFYPVAYGVGICCFVQCLVVICDIIKIRGGQYDE
ncbi:MAG: TRAP transporter small permease [Deltaproteobacteria bacterium]|nr:TRAP transporter small permease [Deltaproteobacteria bacterium]